MYMYMQKALMNFVLDIAPDVEAPSVSLRDAECARRWCLVAARSGGVLQGEVPLEMRSFIRVLRKILGRDREDDVDEAKKDGLSPVVETFLYIILSAIALSVVLFHRFLPMRFKDADIFFAGDHFVEDTVRCFVISCCLYIVAQLLIVFIIVLSCSMQNVCLTRVSVQQCRLRFRASLVCYASPSLAQTNY